jgi:hypothetical protein
MDGLTGHRHHATATRTSDRSSRVHQPTVGVYRGERERRRTDAPAGDGSGPQQPLKRPAAGICVGSAKAGWLDGVVDRGHALGRHATAPTMTGSAVRVDGARRRRAVLSGYSQSLRRKIMYRAAARAMVMRDDSMKPDSLPNPG